MSPPRHRSAGELPRRPGPLWLAACVLALPARLGYAQAEGAGVSGADAETWAARPGFAEAAPPEAEPGSESEGVDLTLNQSGLTIVAPARPEGETPLPGEVNQLLTDLWMLAAWAPRTRASPAEDESLTPIDELADRAAIDPLRARTDRWTTGLFSRDAELLTPLAPGREILSWDVTERLTLSGVGGSRIWDYREREFVVSAEAGVRLSARAGIHVGYEVLQTSTASLSPDVSGESIFARFQLRF